jgi:hypothetical protein
MDTKISEEPNVIICSVERDSSVIKINAARILETTRLHGVTYRKTAALLLTAVRISSYP